MRGKMKKYSLNKIPMILASLGLFAGIQAEDKTLDKVPADCSSLCADVPNYDCMKDFEFSGAAVYEQIRVQAGEPAFISYDRNQTYYPVNGFGVQLPEIGSWGFKLGAAYNGWSNDWSSGVRYFYFQAVSDFPVQNAYNSVFIPSVFSNQFLDNGNELTASGFANLQLGNKTVINNIKFSIGRANKITDRVTIEIFSNVEATIISRRQIAVFTNDVVEGQTSLVVGAAQARYPQSQGGYYQNYQKYTWWGVGPGVGSRGEYYLGKGIGIYAVAEGSVKYGLISTRTSTLAAPKVQTYPGGEAIMLSNLYQFSPGLDFELGINWKHSFDEDQVRVSFGIGYENGFYFFSMRTPVPDTNTRAENGAGLGLQGLVLQGAIEF